MEQNKKRFILAVILSFLFYLAIMTVSSLIANSEHEKIMLLLGFIILNQILFFVYDKLCFGEEVKCQS